MKGVAVGIEDLAIDACYCRGVRFVFLTHHN